MGSLEKFAKWGIHGQQKDSASLRIHKILGSYVFDILEVAETIENKIGNIAPLAYHRCLAKKKDVSRKIKVEHVTLRQSNNVLSALSVSKHNEAIRSLFKPIHALRILLLLQVFIVWSLSPRWCECYFWIRLNAHFIARNRLAYQRKLVEVSRRRERKILLLYNWVVKHIKTLSELETTTFTPWKRSFRYPLPEHLQWKWKLIFLEKGTVLDCQGDFRGVK